MFFNTQRKIPSHLRHQYYKEYKNLKFDIIRSKQQAERWYRLTRLVLKHESANKNREKPMLTIPDTRSRRYLTIKVIQHVPMKFLLQEIQHTNFAYVNKHRKSLKNHRRNLKRKRQLPPLPPGTKGDARAYYRDFHNRSKYKEKVLLSSFTQFQTTPSMV
jgi:hypothetical protein